MKLKKLASVSIICFSSLMAQGQILTLDNLIFYEVNQQEFLSIDDLSGEKGVVFIFTSSYCPYSAIYEGRLIKLKNDFEDNGLNFVMINSNNSKGGNVESIPKMRDESARVGFRYISDQSHDIMKAMNVTKNPEVVVLRKNGNQILKMYQGAIDDSPKSESLVKNEYLRRVLTNTIQNKPSPIKNTRPIGCLIK